MAKKMPIISVTGPRQSGKTTLVKHCFPDYQYYNLENPSILDRAQSDPEAFLSSSKKGIIIDEVQRFPQLFSYIQSLSDEHQKKGFYILTGSQNFLLSEKITQSLAGRVYISHLLPLGINEIQKTKFKTLNVCKQLFYGGYPRLLNESINPHDFFPSYIQTYIERDVRQMVNAGNISNFRKLLILLAGRVGQMLNMNELANLIGVDVKTIKSWCSILESSFIIFLLQPYHKNFNKRIIKTPKIYFYDTGLVCSLLGLTNYKDIDLHWAKGALFENLVIADTIKTNYHQGSASTHYYFRNSHGIEVDLLIENSKRIEAIEIKSGTRIISDHFKGLKHFESLSDSEKVSKKIIYAGKETYEQNNTIIQNWTDI